MELNSHCSSTNSKEKINYKKYLLVKLPANVKNPQKAIECLGGKEKILNKHFKDDDLDFNFFNKKIALEKCASSDFLIKRKRLRNKNKLEEVKFKFELVGKVDSVYDYFALHDFVCQKHEKEKFSIDMLESIII
jgi:hypothetical protein